MAEIIKHQYQFKRGTAEEWQRQNTILKQGEPGFEYDTGRLKMGDGFTPWNLLEYVGADIYTLSDIEEKYFIPLSEDIDNLQNQIDNIEIQQPTVDLSSKMDKFGEVHQSLPSEDGDLVTTIDLPYSGLIMNHPDSNTAINMLPNRVDISGEFINLYGDVSVDNTPVYSNNVVNKQYVDDTVVNKMDKFGEVNNGASMSVVTVPHMFQLGSQKSLYIRSSEGKIQLTSPSNPIVLNSDTVYVTKADNKSAGVITNLASPENNTDATNKEYVDSKIDEAIVKISLNGSTTPEAYGAVGDGKTDDTAAFTAALIAYREVVGDPNKTYYVKDLMVAHFNGDGITRTIKNCKFKGTRTETAIIMGSFSRIDNCTFTNYKTCIKPQTSSDKTAGACYCDIINNKFHDVDDGIYCSEDVGFFNDVVISNNLFLSIGDPGKDKDKDITADRGRGIYLENNCLGVQIHDNCFDVCSNSGITIIQDSYPKQRTSISIYGNYFELNRKCYIYINVGNGLTGINIRDNFYSTNVQNSFKDIILIEKAFTNHGVICGEEGERKIFIEGADRTNVAIYDGDKNKDKKFKFMPVSMPRPKFVTIEYEFKSDSHDSFAIINTKDDKNIKTMFKKGTHLKTIPFSDIYPAFDYGYLEKEREFEQGESLTIYKITDSVGGDVDQIYEILNNILKLDDISANPSLYENKVLRIVNGIPTWVSSD